MVNLGPFWRKLSPGEVRRVSLWALAGLVAAFLVAPLLPPDWRLAAICAEGIGKIITVLQLTRINVGAPGWRVGFPGEFDERETAERHQALSTAYFIVVLLIMSVLVFSGIAEKLELRVPMPEIAPTDLMILAVSGLPAVPAIVLAWRRRRLEALDAE